MLNLLLTTKTTGSADAQWKVSQPVCLITMLKINIDVRQPTGCVQFSAVP